MRLSLRILALFVLCVMVLLAADGAFLVRREMQLLERNMVATADHLGSTYGDLLERVARNEGLPTALDFVARLDRDTVGLRARWLWLDELPAVSAAGEPGQADAAALLEGRLVQRTRRDADGLDWRLTLVSLDLDPDRAGALELDQSYAALVDYRRLIVRRALGFGAVATLLGLLLSWTILRPLVSRPLDRLMAMTERIGAGDFACNLELPGRGELTDLAQAMNRMCRQLDRARSSLLAETEARIAVLEQLRHTERLAVLGRISSGLAHELGTPLNVVGARAGMIESGDLPPGDVDDSARIIREQAERMAGIIRQFLDYARRPSGRHETGQLAKAVQGTVAMLRPMADSAGVRLVVAEDEDLPEVRFDSNQMQQVLTNLVVNALHAMPDGGEVRIALRADGRGGTLITVSDEGLGIAAERLAQIFEPFYTTKETGKGTGLGLSIVKGIVEEHGGRIEVASEPGQGTTFTITLPSTAAG